MDQEPLVNEKINAGAKFLAELDKRLPVKVAFWLKRAESVQWYLYAASEQVDEAARGDHYGDLIAAAQQVRDPNFDKFEIRLIGIDEPLTQAVLQVLGPAPDAVPVRLFNRVLGGVGIAEMYVYPVPLPAAV